MKAFLKQLNMSPSFLRTDPISWVVRMMLILSINTFFKSIQEYYELSILTFWVLTIITWLVALILIYFKDFGNHWSYWILLATGMMIFLGVNWPGSANHLYLFIYLCLILFVSFLNHPKDRMEVLSTNTKWLFVMFMLMAVIQKGMTLEYLNGSINSFWLVSGGYFQPLHFFSSEWTSIVASNHELLNAYFNHNITQVGEVALESPVSNLRKWGLFLSFLILAGEVIVVLIFLLSKSKITRHVAIILFIVLVFLTRKETGFLSLLCIIGMSCCSIQQRKIQVIYCSIFGVLQLLFLFDLGYV